MNFFEHQDKARKQTRTLVVLFGLAVLAIIVAVNLLLFTIFGVSTAEGPADMERMLSLSFLKDNVASILTISFITGALIGLTSLFRAMQLRSGGSVVARQLGGTPVDPDTNDPTL